MTTRLVIARHGNTFGPGEVVRRVGVTDLPLVAAGLLQGEQLGLYLRQQQLVPDVIFTSMLQRTQQTAEAAKRAMQIQLPLNTLSIFNEIDYGPDENQSEEAVIARVGQAALSDWEAHATVPEGWRVAPDVIIKNWQLFAEQLCRDYAGKMILVVTSNGIARFAPYLTGDFAAFSAKHAIKLATGACALFENKTASSPWECLAWNVKPAAALSR